MMKKMCIRDRVEAVRNKGYHIVDSPDVRAKEELDSQMRTCWAGRNILYYTETVSYTHLDVYKRQRLQCGIC